MFKVISKEIINANIFDQISKRLKVDVKDFDFISYDKFLFAYLYIIAVKDKQVYLLSGDNKKVEELPISDIDQVIVEKKTDLNLYLKGGRVISLTSVVGVKPKVMNLVRSLNDELNKLK